MTVAYIGAHARRLYLMTVILHISFSSFGQIEIAENLKQCICGEEAPGKIVLIANGTAGPFSFRWTGPNGYESFRQEPAELLIPGLYTVTVTNAYACETILEVELEACPGIDQIFLTPQSPNCNDPNSGTITMEVLGGVAPFTYVWNTGATTQSLSNISAGTYSITVTDNNECTLSEEVIVEPAIPLEIVGLDACEEAGQGVVSLQVTGGVPPYTYLWSNGATSEILTSQAGVYEVSVTDAVGCTEVANFSIFGEPQILAEVTATPCDLPQGGIELSLVPGQGISIVSWIWSDGIQTEDRTGLAPGEYSVTATDDRGCQFVDTYEILSINDLSINATVTDVTTCNETGNGGIVLTASGGASPYTFDWADGATGASLSDLSAGVYQVTLTDANGCTLSESYTVSSSASDLSVEATVTDDCDSQGEGAIITTVTGGQAPYTYEWGPFLSSTEANLIDISAGWYGLTVTDALGCTHTSSYSVSNIFLPTLTPTITASSCAQDNGSIILSVDGRDEPDPSAFQWSDGQTGLTRNNLAPGGYTVIYTDPNGCSLQETYTILEQNTPFLLTLNPSSSCAGTSTGSITVLASDGIAPYTFAWSDGGTGDSRIDLAAGTYTVTATDANNCQTIQSVEVMERSGLVLTPTITPASCEGTADGLISLDVGGGQEPYTYQWDNGSTSSELQNLVIGDYMVTVTDALGCTSTATYSTLSNEPHVQYPYIESVKVYAVSTSSSVDQVLIYDAEWLPSAWGCVFYTGGMLDISDELWQEMQDGMRELKVVARANTTLQTMFVEFSGISGAVSRQEGTGQLGTFTVNSSRIPSLIQSGSLDQMLTFRGKDFSSPSNDLLDMRYYSGIMTKCVRIPTQNLDCTWEPEVNSQWSPFDNVHRLYKSCSDLDLQVSSHPSGQRIIPTVTGGATPYSKFITTYPDGQTEITPGPFPPTIVASDLGRFCVEVHDADDCVTSNCIDVCPESDEIESIILNSVELIPPCPGGMNGAICLPELPEWPYKTQWTHDGSAGRCLENISAGYYTVNILEYRCGNSAQVRIYLGNQPASITIELVNAEAACPQSSNGILEIQSTGGSSGHTYLWDNGSTESIILGLSSGQCHQVTVTDACGTTEVSCFELPQYEGMQWSEVALNRACSGADGAIEASVLGGKSPYSFRLIQPSTGQVDQKITSEEVQRFGELLPGLYSLEVQDACGQVITYPTTLNVENSADIWATSYLGESITATCGFTATGSIDLEIDHTDRSFEFLWSNGATTEDVFDLYPGSYWVQIFDLESTCQREFQFIVNENADPVRDRFLHGVVSPTCTDQATGEIELFFSDNASLNFIWSNGAITQNITDLSAGTYTVTVSDLLSPCSMIESFEVNNASIEIVSAEIQKACAGYIADGSIQLEVNSNILPQLPLFYSWSNGTTTKDLNNILPGQYCVTISNEVGCLNVTECYQVESFPLIDLSVDEIFFPGNASFPDGRISLNISGGNPPYNILWNTGEETPEIENLTEGIYSVSITDQNGCGISRDFSVRDCSDPAGLNTFLFTGFTVTPPTERYSSDGALDIGITTTGPTQIWYQWQKEGDPTIIADYEDVSDLDEGRYCVTITDGCKEETHCQLVAYCGDLELVDTSEDDECISPEKAAQIEITALNRNGEITYNWNYNSTIRQQDNSLIVTYIDWYLLVDGILNAGHNPITLNVQDEATCETSIEVNAYSYSAETIARWDVDNYFNLADEYEDEAYKYFSSYIANNQANLFIKSPHPYINACYADAYCPDGSVHRVWEQTGLECSADGGEGGSCRCSLSPLSQLHVTCPLGDLSAIVDYVTSYEVFIPIGDGDCRIQKYCLYEDPFSGFPFVFKTTTIGGCTFDGDPDGDGILSSMDNCPLTYNPRQLDCDDDGIGNVCDETPGEISYEVLSATECKYIVKCGDDELGQEVILTERLVDLELCTEVVICTQTGDVIQNIDHIIECEIDEVDQTCTRVRYCDLTNQVISFTYNANCLDFDLCPDDVTLFVGGGQEQEIFSHRREEKVELEITLFPNPTNSELHLKVSNSRSMRFQLEVYNLQGSLLWTEMKSITGGVQQQQIEAFSGLKTGIYFVKITDAQSGRFWTKRVIKAP
ncbi:MAG: T9SS type A sorting domain-containing protein [Cyanothece sp. SIO1E1]|nr:T9SS type A sorting domain-containing protein [Cyanothece sp. SIO1E1]